MSGVFPLSAKVSLIKKKLSLIVKQRKFLGEAELEERLKQVEKQEEVRKVADGFKKEEMELKDAKIARLTRQVEMLQGGLLSVFIHFSLKKSAVTQHLFSRAQHCPLRPSALPS